MTKIKLPDLFLSKKYYSNLITQLKIQGTLVDIIVDGSKVFAKDDEGNVIHFFKKGKRIKKEYKYVIVSNIEPTLENLKTNQVKLNWKKHPLLSENFNPEYTLSTWENSFKFKEEDISRGVKGLRAPQIGAIYAVMSHWKVDGGIGTVVMPTGTGKTETMLSLLIANRCNKLLVTVPTDALREQISKKFITLGFLKDKEFRIVSEDAQFPIVGVLKKNFKTVDELNDFVDKCNVVITTMSLISKNTTSIQKEFSKKFSHLFIDEAHHVQAKSWFDFRNMFDLSKVVQFTATPYRNDGQRLDGKIIFNYPLKKAQSEGYFKKINFKPIREYCIELSDEKIAEAAVDILREDIKNGYNHILMARCANIKRATSVFEIYRKYQEFNPVQIHSGLNSLEIKESREKILNKKSNIVVCVDMFGEGFDLPELKIAAFHDIRKSLPITLQLAGRFTRTKYDEKLGEATIIANLANAEVEGELEELYGQDPDWNLLLPKISSNLIEKEVNFYEFINGFNTKSDNKISLQNLRPALSTVVYTSETKKWNPSNFKRGLDIKKDDIVISDLNTEENVLVIIIGSKKDVDWGKIRDIQNTEWNLIIAYFDKKNNLLFINSSNNNSLYANLAYALMGENTKRIDKMNVFKSFYNIRRARFQNVGLKEFLNKNIRFRMSVGYDIEDALSLSEKKKAQKAFIYGVGYEDGKKVSIGCSYKGRIWSRANGDLKEFTEWCTRIGEKLINPKINPNIILKDTLIPKQTHDISGKTPFFIDWAEDIFLEPESKIKIILEDEPYDFINCELTLPEERKENHLQFILELDENEKILYNLILFKKEEDFDFEIKPVNAKYADLKIKISNNIKKITDYFHESPPTIWFTDGSCLTGNELIELKQEYLPYEKDRIIDWDWNGVNIRKESQGVKPKITDSIQYHVISKLKKENYDIIYDDDGSGEIADIIAIKQCEEKVKARFYHLKYAKGGKVSTKIDNLYEVCGQAQKSIRWKFKESKEFFQHLERRMMKKKNKTSCSRLEVGDVKTLRYLAEITRKHLPVEYEIFIVQPGLSKSKASKEQLILLSVTEQYLKDIGAVNLKVIGSN